MVHRLHPLQKVRAKLIQVAHNILIFCVLCEFISAEKFFYIAFVDPDRI
jgi:hypothetical protein